MTVAQAEETRMPVLALEAAHAAYGRSRVLHGVDLAVGAGSVTAVIGPNGAGKTTLLRLMARLLRPTAGQVRLAGRDLWSLRRREVARQLAYAPQAELPSLPLTVFESVALGRAPHRGWWHAWDPGDHAIIERILDQLDLTVVRDRPLGTLSGGQQRRVTLARALVQAPRILLLDEPTAHLDLHYQAELLQRVREQADRCDLTVVLTLHDLNEAAAVADRIVLLDAGRVAACGSPDEVLRPEVLVPVFGPSLRVDRHPAGGPLVTAWRGAPGPAAADA